MRLKYFIRGIGVGVIVTTLILSIAHASSSKPMSDADVIERAKELGMEFSSLFDDTTGSEDETDNITENNTSSELTTNGQVSESVSEETSSSEEAESTEPPTQETTETTTEENTTEQPTTEEPTTEAPTTQPPTTEPETTTQAPTEEQTTQAPTVDNNGVITYQLEIVRGMSSNKVSEAIAAAGIISNAKELDEFLVRNGYADRIRVGTFTLNSGMSYQDIANTITGN